MMDRFKSILVAASPGYLEPEVLRPADELAETNHARSTVPDVMEPAARIRRFMTVRRRTVDVHLELLRRRSERLRLLVRNTPGGACAKAKVLVGESFIDVISHVPQHDNDLVIVGGRAVENRALPEFPSGVMHLVRKRPVPDGHRGEDRDHRVHHRGHRRDLVPTHRTQPHSRMTRQHTLGDDQARPNHCLRRLPGVSCHRAREATLSRSRFSADDPTQTKKPGKPHPDPITLIHDPHTRQRPDRGAGGST